MCRREELTRTTLVWGEETATGAGKTNHPPQQLLAHLSAFERRLIAPRLPCDSDLPSALITRPSSVTFCEA